MRALRIDGISLPLPDNWQKPDDGKSYVGEGGLLDVRVKAHGVPVDQERLKIAEERFADRGGQVSLITVQGANCLIATYKESDCSVITYTFEVALDREIVAVYVFRPGYDLLAKLVQEDIVRSRD